MQRSLSSSPAGATVSGRTGTSKNKARGIAGQQAAVSAYVADISAELARMAGEAELPMLAYFLNLARVEAEMAYKAKSKES